MAANLLSSQRNVKERVKSYAPAVVAELVQEGNYLSASLRDEIARSSSAPAGGRDLWYYDPTVDSLQQRARAQRAVREAEMREREVAHKASVEKRQQEKARKEDAEFQSMYSEVLAGLSNASGIMGETAYALEHSAKVKAQKKGTLHAEWSTQVFDRLQGRLQEAVDRRDPRDIEARLKQQYDQFLHTTNTKVGVFRDVIIEQDYNPMTANQSAVRIPTGDIRDPLKRDVLKGEYERQLMGAGGPGPGSGSSYSSRGSLGKETLSPQAWGDLAIHSTPYGHCVDRTGAYVVRPLSSNAAKLRESRIPLDHYNYPVGNEHAAAEQPKGKGMPPGPEVRRGRQDLFDVVQHTCALRPPSYTGGDAWLEHKGKIMPPGPEERRGRKDLSEVLQQTSNPYQDGRPLGDAWLEHKGKARAAAPDAKSGRNGLFETIQQVGNPYVDGRTLDDSWLQHQGRRILPRIDANMISSTLAGRAPPPERKPPRDERKYETHLVAIEGQLTAKE